MEDIGHRCPLMDHPSVPNSWHWAATGQPGHNSVQLIMHPSVLRGHSKGAINSFTTYTIANQDCITTDRPHLLPYSTTLQKGAADKHINKDRNREGKGQRPVCYRSNQDENQVKNLTDMTEMLKMPPQNPPPPPPPPNAMPPTPSPQK